MEMGVGDDMIYSKLTQWRNVSGFTVNPVWSEAFRWLETAAGHAPEGTHSLGRSGFEARVMTYEVKTREQARYEMHRDTIDIQFTLNGGEAIEVIPEDVLEKCNDYDAEKDVEFMVTPPASQARVENREGFFTVLFAGEPHMPQLGIPGIKSVRKVVVKIPVLLLRA
jgi:YhcH/YjgK/YiaL family protein